MSDKYKIRDNDKAYFATMTIVAWIDIFTRKQQRLSFIGSLDYCQKNKGLVIFAYCLMGSHFHMICKAEDDINMFSRGFTGHEHLEEFGLINMNGRLYDPALGRFLSSDPYVQAPGNAQNYNRYSYCLNNPLKYTDPDGYNPLLIAIGVGAIVGAYINTSTQTGEYAPWKWNTADHNWWQYTLTGAIAGGVGAYLGPAGYGMSMVQAGLIAGGIGGGGNLFVDGVINDRLKKGSFQDYWSSFSNGFFAGFGGTIAGTMSYNLTAANSFAPSNDILGTFKDFAPQHSSKLSWKSMLTDGMLNVNANADKINDISDFGVYFGVGALSSLGTQLTMKKTFLYNLSRHGKYGYEGIKTGIVSNGISGFITSFGNRSWNNENNQFVYDRKNLQYSVEDAFVNAGIGGVTNFAFSKLYYYDSLNGGLSYRLQHLRYTDRYRLWLNFWDID